MSFKKIFIALLIALFLAPTAMHIDYSFAKKTDGGAGKEKPDKKDKKDKDKKDKDKSEGKKDKKDKEDKSDEKEEKEDKAPKKEYSAKEKAVMAGSMAAAGIGGMQLAQGLSEMKADKEAAADMENYLKTITCGIGGATNVKYAESGTAPEQTRQFADERLKYIALAQKVKHAKEMLGMAPGIESEIIVDTANLYSGRGTDKDGISRHLDTAAERLESKSGQKRAIIGGVVAAAGVVGGIVGNAIVSKEDGGASGKESADSNCSAIGGGTGVKSVKIESNSFVLTCNNGLSAGVSISNNNPRCSNAPSIQVWEDTMCLNNESEKKEAVRRLATTVCYCRGIDDSIYGPKVGEMYQKRCDDNPVCCCVHNLKPRAKK